MGPGERVERSIHDEWRMIKIVVQNYADQFALSRKQVETIIDVLPDKYFAKIRMLLLCSSASNKEPFEYAPETQVAYFSYPVSQKTGEDVERAVEAMLVGLARIEAGDTFRRLLRDRDRRQYDAFVAAWKDRIMGTLAD